MALKLARAKRSSSAPDIRPKPGDVIAGKYRIERAIGEGGMGAVYAAHHELLDQRVALKLLFGDGGVDRETVARFMLEARAAARLQSEHVARVMDVDTLAGGLPFIVMEYLEGSDLSAQLATHGPIAPALVADYVLQALEAIAQAHAQGIIHRDLKPSNLFLTTRPDGSEIIKILDFGISKSMFHAGIDPSLTSNKTVLGSPAYMSPEQVRSSRSVDCRTDIWSLGVVMYELLCGEVPFAAEQIGELFAAILEQDPPRLGSRRSQIPEALQHVVERCLTRNREHRYLDVGEMAYALAPFSTGAQAKSADRIAQTLMRAEELSHPRRRALSGVPPAAEGQPEQVTALARKAGAGNAPLGQPGAELSGTASNVEPHQRSRYPRPMSSSKRLLVAGSALAAVAFLAGAVFIVGALSRTPKSSATAAAAAGSIAADAILTIDSPLHPPVTTVSGPSDPGLADAPWQPVPVSPPQVAAPQPAPPSAPTFRPSVAPRSRTTVTPAKPRPQPTDPLPDILKKGRG